MNGKTAKTIRRFVLAANQKRPHGMKVRPCVAKREYLRLSRSARRLAKAVMRRVHAASVPTGRAGCKQATQEVER
ncbi:hypothetical protein GX586_12515 [bacterium]|nr:hypothetical protein [bacterium]